MLFFLSYYILEVLFGTTYWILRKTTKGIYYLVSGGDKNDIVIVKKEKNAFFEVLKEMKYQNNKIRELHKKIDELLIRENNDLIEVFKYPLIEN